MPKKKSPAPTADVISLSALFSKKATLQKFRVWVVGDSPLITHAWSHKAKQEMLAKQVKATKGGRKERKPKEDFYEALYVMEEGKNIADGVYGFPVTGFKNALLNAAHKDRGIAKTDAMKAIFFHAQMTKLMPALAGAICDMPLTRIYGSPPEMREDPVRMSGVANFAFRPQFTNWAVLLLGELNTSICTTEAFAMLIESAGRESGVGDWRNEKRGFFGYFHMADADEEKAWDRYTARKGPLPISPAYEVLEAAE